MNQVALSSWNAITDPCGGWAGVTCGGIGTLSVTTLLRNGVGLLGTLPSQLGALTGLLSLNLGANSLSGPLASELGQLSLLTYLNVGGCRLNGSLPSSLGALSAVTYLNASGAT